MKRVVYGETESKDSSAATESARFAEMLRFERETQIRHDASLDPAEGVPDLIELHALAESSSDEAVRELARDAQRLVTDIVETVRSAARDPSSVGSAQQRIEFVRDLFGDSAESVYNVVDWGRRVLLTPRVATVWTVHRVAYSWTNHDADNHATCTRAAIALVDILETPPTASVAEIGQAISKAARALLGETVDGGVYRKTLALLELVGLEDGGWREAPNCDKRIAQLRSEVSTWRREHRIPPAPKDKR